jgi:hypothetical protein
MEHINLEFNCPDCGSNYFGTSGNSDGSNRVVHCHGYIANSHPCTFSTPACDEWKYFCKITRVKFESHKDYTDFNNERNTSIWCATKLVKG